MMINFEIEISNSDINCKTIMEIYFLCKYFGSNKQIHKFNALNKINSLKLLLYVSFKRKVFDNVIYACMYHNGKRYKLCKIILLNLWNFLYLVNGK